MKNSLLIFCFILGFAFSARAQSSYPKIRSLIAELNAEGGNGGETARALASAFEDIGAVTVSGAVLSVPEGGILVECSDKVASPLCYLSDPPSKVSYNGAPPKTRNIIFLMGHPDQTNLADGDPVCVVALPVQALYHYISAEGTQATVHAFEVLTEHSRP